MYKTITKTALAVAISATVSFSVLAVSTDQQQQLDNAIAKTNQSQDEKIQEFHTYVNAYLDEYEAWRDEYINNLDERRTSLIKTWGEGEVSSKTKQVDYSQDDQVKVAVDYENNTATVSVLVDKNSSDQELEEFINKIPVEVAGQTVALTDLKAADHTVLYSFDKEQEEKNFVIEQTQSQMNELDVQAERLVQSNTGIPDSFIYQRAHTKKMALLAQAQERITAQAILYKEMRAKHGIKVKQSDSVEQSNKTNQDIADIELASEQKTPESATDISTTPTQLKKVVSYKVKLPENSLKSRASQYTSLAEKESEQWAIDAALIMAIMHSESAFRPDAKSHVPAFGLMQIVPTSAGHDVNKQVRNIDAPMKAADLYQPVINVETGTAYLNILNNKYLRKIDNDESRLYCMIAAYNTGAGNVARAFNKDGSTNIAKASAVINKLTPKEVYNQLTTNLPYDETKNYLKKVNSRIQLYK
ncbi:transglycosylase SLT domain-containing protein [Vibrio sp. MA40-2]|uniref:transglycosylase SLT domain-containing protein n=1 Tax=Vibrio sp. MA40-2 TaxID=3391828 RepID=UPI0039A72238